MSGDSLLARFVQAGALGVVEEGIGAGLVRICGDARWELNPRPGDGELVELALALCIRALRQGSVCIDVRSPGGMLAVESEWLDPAALPWPSEPGAIEAALQRSPMVSRGPDATGAAPMRLVDGQLYLERYWAYERCVAGDICERLAVRPEVDEERLAGSLARLFPGAGAAGTDDEQCLAAAAAALRGYTVITGGPGTGKTFTVAKVLAALAESSPTPLRVALAAPTGKAAKRLTEVVTHVLNEDPFTADDRRRLGALQASTLHRLLGFQPGGGDRFAHDRRNQLPFDVVVVDETSMVPLVMMARLLEATPPHARLILVGDAGQLASVEAGAVLADLVGRPGADDPDLEQALTRVIPGAVTSGAPGGVVRLTRNYRVEGRDLVDLGAAIRDSRPGEVFDLLARGEGLEFVEAADPEEPAAIRGLRADVVSIGSAMVRAAADGNATEALELMGRHRLMCAHGDGRFGVRRWNLEARRWISQACGDRSIMGSTWYVGEPVLVTRNDYSVDLYNGDTGVVVATPDGLRVAFQTAGTRIRLVAPARIDGLVELQAMTVHKGQGSEFDRVTFLLPGPDSPLLTRELLYTGVTRARRAVRLIGSRAAVEAALAREVRRASGLRRP
ncbi:MAG: exodeoxyribonuclease V subunit alpha [Candidatus Nanopelagicales bacterium]